MSSPAVPFITAGLKPEFFSDAGTRAVPRTILILALSVLVIAGFALRSHDLASEGLSEDELNKLNEWGQGVGSPARARQDAGGQSRGSEQREE